MAPTSSTITLTAASRTLPIGGTTEVSATVLESGGTPVQNGTTVRFTTTLGSVTPIEAQTRNGVATVTFNAGSASGTAEVRATSGGAGGTTTTGTGSTATTTATNTLQITIGSANASRVGLTASPTVVPSTGGSSTITASVFDAAGNPLSNVSVFFSTDAGTLSASSAATDASGRAAVTLTTTRKATVTATVGTGTTSGSGGTTTTDTRTATVVVDVNVAAGATLRCLGTGSTAAVGCTQAVGSAVTFTIDRSTTTGASAINNATIDFGDGTTANLGPVTGTTTVTHTYQSAGTYTATLRTTDSMGEVATVTNTVTVTPRTPVNVALAVTLGTAVPNVGQTATFTATVTPSTELIESYTWDFGDGTVITTSGNTTSHVYTSNGVKRATVTIRTVDGRTASASVEFIVSGV